MKTPEQKLKFVMEAAGECYHEPDGEDWDVCGKCKHKAKDRDGFRDTIGSDNPSPDDMNKLMELAEKLNLPDPDFITGFGNKNVELVDEYNRKFTGTGSTHNEALLNALFVAKGGLEDE